MSHYFVGVIVRNPKQADQEIEKNMASYSENASVEPYEEECGCVGCAARTQIYGELEKKFGKMDDARKKFGDEIALLPQAKKNPEWQFSKAGSKLIDKKWQKLMKPRFDAEELLKETNPDINKADVSCEECNGTGKTMSTYNPKSKWDWYVVGGRWDGMISNDRKPSKDGGFNFGDEHHQLGNNILSVKEYLKIATKYPDKVVPFAIVTPEGEWCEKGKMGWWAMVSDEKDEDKWLNEAVEIVKKYQDCYIVGVDCHI